MPRTTGPLASEPLPRLGDILVVDDEPALLSAICQTLTAQGFEATGYASGAQALTALEAHEFDLVLTDLMMPAMDGISVLRAGQAIDPNLVGILMTGQGTVKTAIEAMKAGAFDYVLKPFKVSALLPILARALDFRRLRLDNLQLRESVAIYELTQAIAVTLDRATILDKTVDAALQQCQADEASIMLPSPDGQELVLAVVRGEGRAKLVGTRAPMGTGIAGWVARERGPLTLTGDVRDARFAPRYPRAEIQSAISVPMLSGNQLIGVLNLNLLKSRRRFSLGQVKAVSILVNTAAAALHNAQLHDELAATEERFRALIENSSDGIILLNAENMPVYTSPSTTHILGYSVAELLSETVWRSFVHPDDRPAFEKQIAELARRPQPAQSAQYRFKDRTGAWRWLEITASNLLAQPAVNAIVINYRDITDRHQSALALADERNLLRTLIDNIPDAIYVKDLEARFAVLNLASARLIGVATTEAAIGKSDYDFYPLELANRYRADDLSVLRSGRPVVDHEEPLVDAAARAAWYLTTKVPLRDGQGQVTGLVGIGHDITERKERERELEAIAAVSRALRSATTSTDMLPILLDQVHELLAADGVGIAMENEMDGGLICVAARGAFSGRVGQRLATAGGIGAHVLVTGQPFATEHFPADPRYALLEARVTTEAAICLPLMTQQKAQGIIWIGRHQPFSSTAIRILVAIADIAASALQRAGLHEQTARRLERLEALHNIDLVIAAGKDLGQTLAALLGYVTAQLNVDAASLLLLHPHDSTLEYVASRGFESQALLQSRPTLTNSLAGQVVAQRRSISIPDLRAAAAHPPRDPHFAAENFVSYHAVPMTVKGQVTGVLEVLNRTPVHRDREWSHFLETLGGQAAIAVEQIQLFDGLQLANQSLSLAYDATIAGWSRALDLRDHETEGHSLRVTQMTLSLARALGIDPDKQVQIQRGALLHDIGKMGIPDSILLKPGPLTEAEWAIMRQHPTIAYTLLARIAFLDAALDIPYCHHEKWDGSGYPRGLVGDAIPLAARIFAVADVWDALTANRPYRPAWPPQKAAAHIREQAGRHFDPAVVDLFEAWLVNHEHATGALPPSANALPVLLIVDDEANIVRSLMRSLRSEFTVLTAQSGQAALDLLEREKVAVILTDQRMPGLTGLQLLQRARELSPATRGLLISGYSDSISLAETLNLTNVRGFIPKPWDGAALERQLRAAAEEYAALLGDPAPMTTGVPRDG